MGNNSLKKASSGDEGRDQNLALNDAELQAMAGRMRAAVRVCTRKYHLKSFPKCFLGSEAVSWLQQSGAAADISDALVLGNMMLHSGLLHHVTGEHDFEDRPLFYRFSVDETHHGQAARHANNTVISWGEVANQSDRLGYDPAASGRGTGSKRETLPQWLPRLPPSAGGRGAVEAVSLEPSLVSPRPMSARSLLGEGESKSDDEAGVECEGKDQGKNTFEILGVSPLDAHNVRLLDGVHPRAWIAPAPKGRYNLVVIGGGAGGLTAASAAAAVGARVAIVEQHLLGGDCLNVGCVPSKALLRCARAVKEVKNSATFGVCIAGPVTVDFAKVMERMRRIRADISPVDSAESKAAKGVDVFMGRAIFTGKRQLDVEMLTEVSLPRRQGADAGASADTDADADAGAGTGADMGAGVGAGAGASASAGGSGGWSTADGSLQFSKRIMRLEFNKAIIASGASPAVPQISGLATCPFLTNRTIFNLTTLPQSMLVIGAGPIGLELAQAFAIFGTQVTCLVRGDRILGREDPDAAVIVQKALERDGVRFVFNVQFEHVEVDSSPGHASSMPSHEDLARLAYTAPFTAVRVVTRNTGRQGRHPSNAGSGSADAVADQCVYTADTLLVATGRKPNVQGMGLDAAGVAFDEHQGVRIDDLMRTSNPQVYAVGDCCTAFQFTHVSGTMGYMAMRNALFFGRLRMSRMLIPWVTFTSPEVAHVGLYESDIDARGMTSDTYMVPLAENDRAVCDGDVISAHVPREDEGAVQLTEPGGGGFVKVHCVRGTDEIMGATIVAENAGDMISEITLTMQNKLGLSALSGVIHPYPTQAEMLRAVGSEYAKTKLTPRVKKLLAGLMAVRR